VSPPTGTTLKENEDADELEGVQPFVMSNGKVRSLPQSFRDWLKPMVVNINAVNTLVSHINMTSLKQIKIKILVPPPVSSYKTMLHWEEMLRSHFFPPLLVGPEDFNPSHNRIITFLKAWSGASCNTVDSMLRYLRVLESKKDKADFREDLRKAPGHLSTMPGCEVEGWKVFRDEIISGLSIIPDKYLDSKPQLLNELDSEACHFLQSTLSSLQSLKDSAMLFKMLAKMPKSKAFKGTSHCKANISAFWSTDLEKRWKETANQLDVSHMNDIYTSIILMIYEMQGAKGVIGISKLCCPVC
jgi:hypothetical protein